MFDSGHHARVLLVSLALLAGRGAVAAVVPNATLTADQQASRFLAQATFGPSPDSIAELRSMGNDFNAWIDREAAKPVTAAVSLLASAKAAGVTMDRAANRKARNQVMLSAPDQLRQRMAYALSQIMVISDVDGNVGNGLEGSSSYYDMLARNALGNFRTLMMDVTRHPMMGRYLSHYKNRKANPTTGTRPDENYAREAMQLFTIGLYNLNANGTYQTSGGKPVESYTNDNITEFARVYTGFTDDSTVDTGTGTGRTDFPRADANFTAPMRMWELQHDTDAKTLLSYPGARKPVLPAGQSGVQDVADAIDNLVEHPNTAPFISRMLIQRLVTSNPTDGYVGRVAAVFANNGAGVRGDLKAVAKAILLDPEARDASFITDPEHGKLREPFLRVTHVLRAFRYTVTSGTLPYDFSFTFTEDMLGQYPLSSPSVFNFYAPDYQPAGPIGNAGLFGPEFQILNSVFAITTPNAMNTLISTGAGNFKLNLAEQESLAADPAALLNNLDLLLTHGTLSAESRAAILKAVQGVTQAMVPSGGNLNLTRAQLAVYLMALSPDFAVLK
ncbi:MAG TPA: DUF1800 domain-containing protein [Lacunisphaera sp.]|nr:DUF1800 domain-containing protein [Lacunisphaera sp.]